MAENNGLFMSNRLKLMIRQYAVNPDLFFLDGKGINREYIDELIKKHININPRIRSGKACIKGTRAAVCDIIIDTWSLGNQKKYLLKKIYYPAGLTDEAFDAAYAFLMRFHGTVAKDCIACFEQPLPKDLYS